MVAKADPTTDVTGATETVTAEQAYSAFAARRGVQPTLTFKHQLARFKFQIMAGAESGMNVEVTAIEMLNQQATGFLKVVGEDLGITVAEDDPGTTTFTLMQTGADGLTELEPTKPKTEFNNKQQNPDPIGESIMIIPGGTECEIRISTNNADPAVENPTPIAPETFPIKASNVTLNDSALGEGATFEAGKEYTITMVIYGPEKIVITATLDEWDEGGEVVWDPDVPNASN